MSSVPRFASTVPGRLPRLGTVLASEPAVLDAFSGVYASFWSHGSVDHLTKETVRLRNARVTDCGY